VTGRNARLLLAAALLAVGLAAVPATGAGAATAGWTGTFDGFPGPDWTAAWGQAAQSAWGLGDTLTSVADASSPSGAVLDVRYGAGSSAHSCTNCPNVGGGEFYTRFSAIGHADWGTAPVLDLKYSLRFASGFDFGKGGKLPGLYGGEIAQASGGIHGDAWSTRYMWRKPSKGEVYFYSPTGSGYGKDLGLGKWSYAADGKWHTVEQLVERTAQRITVYYDGKQVYTTKVTGMSAIPFSGVFFSTFFGGHEKSWGPKRTVHAAFAAFSVSTSIQH